MACLWTFGRYLEASRLPRPALSGAAIFVAGGWLGALASANLDAYYVTCGASAGVCALLGARWRVGWWVGARDCGQALVWPSRQGRELARGGTARRAAQQEAVPSWALHPLP